MKILASLIVVLVLCFSAYSQTDKSLYLVKKIYIGDMGKSDEAERFKLLLDSELSKKGFAVVEKQEDADATLSGILTVRVYDDTSIARATVALKDREGKRLWGDDFEPKTAFFKRVSDTVKFRAENVAGRFRKEWEKSAKAAGVKVEKVD